MAGAMRRMGVYLGLVEDDDARGGYDRYAASYDDDPAAPAAADRYGYGSGHGYDDDYPADAPAEVPRLADLVADTPSLRLCGLMAVAPRGEDPAPAFARLAELAARVRADHPDSRELSAGMSADLEAAVTAGATVVRVGTALFGARALSSEPGV